MTTRTLALGLRVLVVLGGSLVAARAQSGFQEALPPETLAFFGVDDATALRTAWRGSPLGRLYADPACDELRRMVGEQLGALGDEAEMALGVDVLRLPDLIEGPLAIALLDLEVDHAQGGDPAISLCVLADVGEHIDEVRVMLDELAGRLVDGSSGIGRSTATVEQTEVTSFSDALVDEHAGSRLRYALQNTIAVVLVETGGPDRDDLPQILRRLKTADARGLSSTAAFSDSLAGVAGDNVRIWADLGRIVAASSETADEQHQKTLRTLGLPEIGVLSMRLECSPKGSYAAMRLDWPGEGWIPRMLRNFFRPGEFSRLRHVPAGVRGIDALHLDLGGLFDSVIKLLIDTAEVSPAEVVQGLQEAEQFLGFSPREDLLGLFDGEFVFVSADVDAGERLPTMVEDLNVALIAGLDNAQAFNEFLDELMRKRGMHVTHKTEEYQGVTLHYQSVFGVPVPICYVVIDDMLVASGAPSLVRQIVDKRNHPEAPSIAELPAYRDAVAAMRPGYGLLGYSDAAADMKSLLRFLAEAPELFGDADESGVLAWLDEVPLPDESIVDQYFHGGTATAFTVDAQGLFLESAGP